MKPIFAFLVVLPVVLGCSSEQLYNSAAGARQQECTKMMNRDDYERCQKAANRSYGEYEQLKK